MLKLIRRLKPFAAYVMIITVILIMVVSSIPHIPTLKIHTAKSDIRLDYLIHFCEYGFLAFMSYLAFTGNNFRVSALRFILVTLCVILFALLDEYHQKFIPGRTFNPKDLISNISGIIFAALFCIVVFRKISLNPDR